jgi:hypothetical protein
MGGINRNARLQENTSSTYNQISDARDSPSTKSCLESGNGWCKDIKEGESYTCNGVKWPNGCAQDPVTGEFILLETQMAGMLNPGTSVLYVRYFLS